MTLQILCQNLDEQTCLVAICSCTAISTDARQSQYCNTYTPHDSKQDGAQINVLMAKRCVFCRHGGARLYIICLLNWVVHATSAILSQTDECTMTQHWAVHSLLTESSPSFRLTRSSCKDATAQSQTGNLDSTIQPQAENLDKVQAQAVI